MPRVFQPARFAGSSAPEVQSMQYDVAQVFTKGAVLVYEGGATGEVIEGAADPAAIVGVALEAANSKPGFGVGNAASIVATTGRAQEVSVAKANRQTIFTGRGTSAPTLASIGVAYGIVKSGSDWIVDVTDVVNTRVRIIDVDVDNALFFFRFLEAALAQP